MTARALIFALLLTGCVITPELPPDICKQTHRVAAGEESLTVDFYFRPGQTPRPLAVVVHGFMANKDRMAHWGVLLAREGFIVAVPTNPTLVDSERNKEGIVGLVQAGKAGGWPVSAKTDGRVALVGFSRGGFETVLAAAELGDAIGAWVGLDPVDRQSKGDNAASEVHVPGVALLADPEALNANRNAAATLSAYAGPLHVLEIHGAGHLDAESPRGNGKFSEFGRHAVAFLHGVFEM